MQFLAAMVSIILLEAHPKCCYQNLHESEKTAWPIVVKHEFKKTTWPIVCKMCYDEMYLVEWIVRFPSIYRLWISWIPIGIVVAVLKYLRFVRKQTNVNARSCRSTKVDDSKVCDIPVVCLYKVKGGARVAFEDEFGAAKEREVLCEAQQGRSEVKRKLFRSFRNKIDEAVARHGLHMSSIPDRDGMYIQVLKRDVEVVRNTSRYEVRVRNLVVVGILTFCKADIRESKMIGLELEQEATKVVVIKETLNEAKDLSPWKGVVRFGKKGELTPRVMFSSNHPTSDIEDAFSSNSPNYTLASPDYSSASPRNNSSESSNNSYGLVQIASPTLLLFYDDLYIKRQVCTLVPPSFSVYTPTSLQIFKIGKRSIKMHLKHHKKQIKDILNYLEELSFHRLKKMEERPVNGWMIIQRDCDKLKTKLEKVRSQISRLQKKHIGQKDKIDFACFRISTLEITLKDIQALTDSVDAALEAQDANMANTDNTKRNLKPRETHVARKFTYKEFMSFQSFYFNGMEGAVGLIRWFERTELAFSRSNCIEDCKVKFATGTLTKDALSWWNSYAKPIGIEQADKIA
nr:reverse transcriptase domain-containing protein [Tanacetum cinerariifolium]